MGYVPTRIVRLRDGRYNDVLWRVGYVRTMRHRYIPIAITVYVRPSVVLCQRTTLYYTVRDPFYIPSGAKNVFHNDMSSFSHHAFFKCL